MHTKNISFELETKGIEGKDLLGLVQGYFKENKLEAIRFAIVKAEKEKVRIEAIVMEADK